MVQRTNTDLKKHEMEQKWIEIGLEIRSKITKEQPKTNSK